MGAEDSPGRNRLLGALTILVGLAIALLMSEFLVRVFFDEPVQPRFVIDAGYGVRANQPNVSTRHYVSGDYEVEINTNSAGMRGVREYSIARTPNVRRILILGDSFSFGFGVEDEEVVSAVLEDMLNSREGAADRYEVINLSVSGFGQAEELVTYRELGRQYQPDVVILFYYDNDVGNNTVSDLFVLEDDASVSRTDQSYLPAVTIRERLYSIAPIRWLFVHSQAWNLVRNRLSSLVQKSLLQDKGLQTFSSDRPEAVALTKELIRQFIADIRNDGAEAVLLVIPRRADLTSNFPLSDRDVDEYGASLVDGRKFLTVEDYYVRDTHWRPSGHRKAAVRLLELVERQR